MKFTSKKVGNIVKIKNIMFIKEVFFKLYKIKKRK